MTVKIIKRDFRFDKNRNDNSFLVGNNKCYIEDGCFEFSEEPEHLSLRFVNWTTGDTICDHPFEVYFYKNNLFRIDINRYRDDEMKLLVKEHYFKHNEKFKKLQKEIKLFESVDNKIENISREPIPEQVRFSVWRRDEGKCVQCGSNKYLEFDHIIPFSKGGSNTERNLQLLCEKCNREKSSKI